MRWSFESEDAGSAYSARRALIAYLQSRATDDSDFEAAAMVFGELVGNVVRHAPGPISIELSWERGIAVLRVTDRGPGFAWDRQAGLPETMAESGRGLFIARTVADRLEVAPTQPSGMAVTAWLPIRLDEQRIRKQA